MATEKQLSPFDVSLETANSFYTFGWKASLTGAFITLIGVTFLMWGTRIRDHDFEEQMGRLNKEAAESQERAAELKAANLALEIKMLPRRVSYEDSAKLSDAISKLAPMGIGIVSKLLDAEGSAFADDLSTAFANGKWNPVRIINWTNSSFKGLALASLEGTAIPKELSDRLLSAFGDINIPITILNIKKNEAKTTDPEFQERVLYLVVGQKP